MVDGIGWGGRSYGRREACPTVIVGVVGIEAFRGWRMADRNVCPTGEGVDRAGEDAEAGEGEDGAGLLAEILGIAGAVPVDLELLDLVLQPFGGEVLREAGFLLLLQLGFHGQGGGEPVVDVMDDLADAGLGEVVFVGEGAGGDELDEMVAVDFEITRGRGEGDGGGHEGAPGVKNEGPRNKNQRTKLGGWILGRGMDTSGPLENGKRRFFLGGWGEAREACV